MVLPQALLFDMDGTIVDTEPYWQEAEKTLFDQLGAEWDPTAGAQMAGMSLAESVVLMRRVSGLDLDEAKTIEWLITQVTNLVTHHGAPWLPGALEVLQLAKELDIPTALVTSSYRAFADAVVAQAPPDAFDAVVAGDEVHRAKPHPEAYQRAAQKLGTQPQQAFAFEDSPAGALAALRSGAKTFVVPGVHPAQADERAIRINSLEVVDEAWLNAPRGS
ncbi:HAD family phosphatase [Gleimia hominis]|uniref:HAD family phosphatase n=1 Tax=Gleimia hominis TaxID=595468 RepID=A0ABU3IB26_9ACTO|nr:HAD family phosphatase [Gleimia hominis]MDT3767582.1 HAD family phosphatase [Gleimia hominis]